VPPLVAPMIHEGSVFLDWNTISPDAKLAISRAAPCEVLDVALLDSLDADGSTPRLAISGPGAEGRRALLEGLGFHVDVAGPAAGDAALLKYARSIFMKSLEGLVLEYVALAHTIDRQGLVAASLANNLGDQFTRFFGLLVSTNRVHAGRRAGELADAVKVFEERGSSVEVARAVVGVLERAAQAWKQPGAPAPNGDLDALVAYLAEKL